jgi:hypothetical protein
LELKFLKKLARFVIFEEVEEVVKLIASIKRDINLIKQKINWNDLLPIQLEKDKAAELTKILNNMVGFYSKGRVNISRVLLFIGAALALANEKNQLFYRIVERFEVNIKKLTSGLERDFELGGSRHTFLLILSESREGEDQIWIKQLLYLSVLFNYSQVYEKIIGLAKHKFPAKDFNILMQELLQHSNKELVLLAKSFCNKSEETVKPPASRKI